MDFYRPNYQVLKYVYTMISDEKRKVKNTTMLKHFNDIIESLIKIGYNPDFSKRPRFTLDRNQKSVPLPDPDPASLVVEYDDI